MRASVIRLAPPIMLPIMLLLASAGPSACSAKDPPEASEASHAPPPPISIPKPTAAAAAVDYYTASALAHVGDSLARGRTTGHMLGARPDYQYLQIRRAANGVPEVHDRWTDVTFVQAGRATLVSGGRVSGGRDEGGGEHRGGTITGGTPRQVASGDLMIIRAGTPHQYLIAGGDSLRYITVKVRETPDGR